MSHKLNKPVLIELLNKYDIDSNIKNEIINAILDYIDNGDCRCENTISKVEYNCHPYGENCSWEECTKCGKRHNFKVF